MPVLGSVATGYMPPTETVTVNNSPIQRGTGSLTGDFGTGVTPIRATQGNTTAPA